MQLKRSINITVEEFGLIQAALDVVDPHEEHLREAAANLALWFHCAAGELDEGRKYKLEIHWNE